MRAFPYLLTAVAVGLACHEDDSAQRTRGYGSPTGEGGRSLELVSIRPPTVFVHGPIEYRVSAEPLSEDAIRVCFRPKVVGLDRIAYNSPDWDVRSELPGSRRVAYTAPEWDVRFYRGGRGSHTPVYSWLHNRLVAGAPTSIDLGPGDTLPCVFTMWGDQVGPELRPGTYELRAVALGAIGREREIVVGTVRVGNRRKRP